MKCGRDGRCCERASRWPLQGDNPQVRGGHWDQIPPTALGGFSLLELLLVAAILVVLASLYFGPSGSSRQRALQAACQKNLQKLYIAMQIYSHDFNDNFPKMPSARTSAEALGVLVPRYTSDTSAFICPASDDFRISDESLKKHKISYAYYMGRAITNSAQVLVTDKQVNTLPKTAGQPLFSSTGKAPGNNHGRFGGNLLFCDGHLDTMPPIASAPLDLTQGEVLLNP